METAQCPISNSREFTPYIQVPDRFEGIGNTHWNIVCSSVSGLLMLNPRPDPSEIALHYRGAKYDPFLHAGNTTSCRDRAYIAARALLLSYRAHLILKDIAKPLQKTTILEIGCSTGELLNFFHSSSGIPLENIRGVEPDTDAAAYARESFGLNISPSIDDAGMDGKQFDRIVLWHSLEHIHAINDALLYAEKLLEPDGEIIIALPNPAGSDARYYRKNWVAYDAPRHLYHFVPETLAKLLALHRLRVIKKMPYLPDLLYNTFHSEVLLCERKNLPFQVKRFFKLFWRISVFAAKGFFSPLTASSLVYFVKKQG